MPPWSFLAAPNFPGDEARTVQARLLDAVLLANIALMGLCAVAALLHGGMPTFVVWEVLAFAGVSVALRICLRRGWVRGVGLTLLLLGFAATTATIARLGTIRVPITGFYLAFVIGGGLLFGLRGLIVFFALGSSAIGGLIVAENSGWLPRPDYAVTLTQWIVSTAILAAVGGWTYFALHSISEALKTAESELVERRKTEALLRERNAELTSALADVKTLHGMLPICCSCKKIRDDKNYWHQVESYISERSNAEFTHGYCPDCVKKYFP